MGPLMQHSNGLLFGTTLNGGAHDQGTVFRLSQNGDIVTLHSFSGNDGAAPTSQLAQATNGILYGTTSKGGANGFGSIFSIEVDGTFNKLIDFTGTTGAAKGSVPNGLLSHPNGKLYGTTQAGGALASGTVFSLTSGGVLNTLVEFSGSGGAAPGNAPVGTLAVDGDALYGLTLFGGSSNMGTFYRLSTSGTFEISRSFTGNSGSQTGSRPSGSLLKHIDGQLYGTTEFGGANGFGVAFKFSTTASPSYTLLHTFADASGSQPSGSLCQDSSGNLFGTCVVGGNKGWGTVYRLTPAGSHSALVHLSNDSTPFPGASPRGGLITSSDGNLYGTTTAGSAGQRGLVFKIQNGSTYNTVSSFTTDLGWNPSGAPIPDRNGNLIFPMAEGGSSGSGTIARAMTDGTVSLALQLEGNLGSNPVGTLLDTGTEFIGVSTSGSTLGRGSIFTFNTGPDKTLLAPFTSTAGESISGPLLKAANGKLYGTSRKGGFANQGSVFSVDSTNTLKRAFSFTGTSGSKLGSHPISPLIQAADGNLFGLTRFTELKPNLTFDNQGTLFKVDSLGAMTSLASFSESGPHTPTSGLFRAPNGKYYATTLEGGTNGNGALFEFDSTSLQWTPRASFTTATTGSQPEGPLFIDTDGLLYGFTTAGGEGFGTLYRFDTMTHALDCLVIFTGAGGAHPGIPMLDRGAEQPLYGGVQRGSDGQLYGVTPAGGEVGGGVVFRIQTTSPLSQWKQLHLGDPDASDSGDPDFDGLTSLEEYAFGLLPNRPDNTPAVQAFLNEETNGQSLSLQFDQDLSRTELTLIIEAANSLNGPWTEIARSQGGEILTGQAVTQLLTSSGSIQTLLVHDAQSSVPLEKRFMRIRITH